MKLVQHPNVVRLYEVIDTQTKLYLILELGDGGDLYDYIMRHDSGLSEEVLLHGPLSFYYAIGLQLRANKEYKFNFDRTPTHICCANRVLLDQ